MGLFDRHKPADSKSEEQSKAEMDAMFERFGAMVEERVKPMRETVDAMQAKWNAIEAEATKTTPPDTRPRDENGNVRELTGEEKQRNLNLALAQQNVQTAARLTERDVLDSLPSDWKHLIPEIRTLFANTEIGRKAQADYAEYCQNCADLVIAREAKKAGLRFNQQSKSFFLEDKSAGGSTPDSILNDPSLEWESRDGRKMSAQEQLRKLGIDPKKFEESAKNGVV
jgi:hypothetical protein